jgi:2-polyprenyl-3-methyl-5-hydroxy-6-metoxy-1,4-benzoquinol methylase
MPHNIFTGEIAKQYDRDSADMFDPARLDATVRFLADAAEGGAVLEFGIGIGRVALPLHERGVEVHGIDISADMLRHWRWNRSSVSAMPHAISIRAAGWS